MTSIPVPTEILEYVMVPLETPARIDQATLDRPIAPNLMDETTQIQPPQSLTVPEKTCPFYDTSMLRHHTSKKGWAYVTCPEQPCPYW